MNTTEEKEETKKSVKHKIIQCYSRQKKSY